MIFIDASVAVAIITQEDDAADLMEQLDQAGGPFFVSGVMRMEATLSIARRLAERASPAAPDMVATARRLVDQFIADLDAVELPITTEVTAKALDAAQQYGKIVNHPARLNLGDCFSYACAAISEAKVAFKGDDFVHTDLGW